MDYCTVLHEIYSESREPGLRKQNSGDSDKPRQIPYTAGMKIDKKGHEFEPTPIPHYSPDICQVLQLLIYM